MMHLEKQGINLAAPHSQDIKVWTALSSWQNIQTYCWSKIKKQIQQCFHKHIWLNLYDFRENFVDSVD